jgi:hypothetical protein
MGGDVSAEIRIEVYIENPVTGWSWALCQSFDGMNDGKRDRTPIMIQKTIDHENIHCAAFADALDKLKAEIMTSPDLDSEEACQDHIERFKDRANELWRCILSREIAHCSHVGEIACETDQCGREVPTSPRNPGPNDCPDCN